MPSDIRSFFGGPPSAAAPAAKPKPAEAEKAKKRGRTKKVVSDDEDDAPAVAKTTPSKKKKAPSPQPVLEEVTAGDFFGTDSKPKKSETVRPKASGKTTADATSKSMSSAKSTPKKTSKQGTASNRSSARKAKNTSNYADFDENDFPDDDLDGDDNFKTQAMARGKAADDEKEDSDEDDKPLVPAKSMSSKQKKPKADEDDDEAFEPDEDVDMKDVDGDDDFVVPDDNEKIVKSKPAKSNGHKRKSSTSDDDDDDELEVEEVRPAKKRAAPAKQATPVKKSKPAEQQTSAAVKAIFDSIPTVEAPPPPPKTEGDSKSKFQFGAHANSAAPAAAIDDSEIPTGADNCLAGLTFVFTGQLQHLGREQGQNLVKRYGGKVTSGPSSKTSYVVLGEDAGPKKLEVIQKFKISSINEDGLFALIKNLPANGGDSAAAEKNAEKRAKEEEEIRKAAAEMEKQERAQLMVAKPKPPAAGQVNGPSGSQIEAQGKGKQSAAGPDSRLWTVRYAPQQVTQICGNKAQVDKLSRWLRAFPKSQKTKFKMPGPDGSGTFRAVMIHGPPGVGKTTAAHLIAKLEGYDIVESNASDTRSKKLVETGLKGVLSTTSLMGYFGTASGNGVDASKKKLVLIMDEVDGMSAGDRGGVGALAGVCKRSQVPMILICNERKQPKMRPFDFVTYDLPFRRPTVDQIRSRMMTIAYREGLKIPPNVVNALIEGSGADIRQVVNMISTAKLDAKNLTYEDGKDMSKAWEKHIVLKPWDMVSKILGGGLFNPASKSTLNDKQELYFNDHEFAPLMLQENYLGTNPQRTNRFNANPKMKTLAQLDLVSKAADAISDGDLVDRMIHGSQQQWSLMPAHAMFSFVRPASFVYGTQAGNQTRFTSWLGKNSNQSKLMRIVKEIQGHMRLRVSADRHEVRIRKEIE